MDNLFWKERFFSLTYLETYTGGMNIYYMTVAASGPNTEILLFDLFIRVRMFPVSPARERANLRKPCLCRIKIKIFDQIWGERVLRTIRKEKV